MILVGGSFIPVNNNSRQGTFKALKMGFLASVCVDAPMNGYIVAVSGGVEEVRRGWESVLSGGLSHSLQSQSVPTDPNACTSHTLSPVFTEGRSHFSFSFKIHPKNSNFIQNVLMHHLQMTNLTFPLQPDTASNEFVTHS